MSACFRSQAPGLVSGQLSRTAAWSSSHPCPGFLSPFDVPAFASWASCSRQGTGPSSRLAYQHTTPARWTLSGFPCSARARPGWGWVPSIPRGRRCPHGRECSPTAACRVATATSLPARHCYPTRTVMLTRHQRGFPVSHPMPSLPLARSPRTEREPSGFPVSFAPSRYRPRTSRWGRVLDTDPKSRRRHQSTSYRTYSLTSCGFTSQALRIPPESVVSDHLVPFAPAGGSPALPGRS
jgi:hypothetical protein